MKQNPYTDLKVVEIRVKSQRGTPWENIEPWPVLVSSEKEAFAQTKLAIKKYGGVEGRWNWEGSNQGHYTLAEPPREYQDFTVNGEVIRVSFTEWMLAVEAFTKSVMGCSVHDLPDCPFRDWFEDGIGAIDAAKKAIRNAWY